MKREASEREALAGPRGEGRGECPSLRSEEHREVRIKSLRTRLWLNLALVMVVGMLLWLTVYQPGKKPISELKRIIDIDPAAITRIVITRPSQQALRLVKEYDHWFLKEPFEVRANESRVRALLQLVQARSQNALDAKAHDLRRFGLTEPRARLQLNEAVFSFGDSHPLSGKRYLLYQDKIYLTVDTVYPELVAEATAFVSPRLVEEDRQPIAIALPGFTLRREGAQWLLNPPNPKISADAIVQLVGEWKRSQAITVKRKREGTPQGTVVLEFQGLAPLRFEIMGLKPELVLARSDLGLEYHLPASAADRLLRLEVKGTEAQSSEQK